MFLSIDGEYISVTAESFYGGRRERAVYQYLYRLPDGRWLIHSLNTASCSKPIMQLVPEDEAIDWLIESRRVADDWERELPQQRSARIAPDWVVPSEEWFQCAQHRHSCPPPVGQHNALQLPKVSRTFAAIEDRQSRFLEPGKVLEHLLWSPLAKLEATAGFRNERHDQMVERLQRLLDSQLFEHPRLSITQSLQDRGCDLLIEWPLRSKYGVQLKSNGDVEQGDFATKTLAQVQDSRQHGLERLFVILAADITENSNLQKVRGMISRISSMNDRYVVPIPPERAWSLLFSADRRNS